ncbi:Cullin family-domain-containing protein [Phakopsora pachyrhizi]|nr:Cullin family-domain-containing protein [Phakopsora pachyrhizi]
MKKVIEIGMEFKTWKNKLEVLRLTPLESEFRNWATLAILELTNREFSESFKADENKTLAEVITLKEEGKGVTEGEIIGSENKREETKRNVEIKRFKTLFDIASGLKNALPSEKEETVQQSNRDLSDCSKWDLELHHDKKPGKGAVEGEEYFGNFGIVPKEDLLQRTTTRLEVVQLKDLLETSFDQDKVLQTCINEGFSYYIDSNRRAAEFISLFIDDKLKKGLNGKTDEEIEDQLEKTISLCRHLNKKDLFEKYSKNHLAKRLLFGKSISEDTEQNMLIKLKVKSGSAFTRDSEGFQHKL